MGTVADELADQIIVTDDNPRSENPAAITRAIISGIKRAVRVIHDRAQAIGTALDEAGGNDVVLIAARVTRITRSTARRGAPISDRREAQRHLGVAA